MSRETRLFSNQVIQNIILFQWRHFRKAFIKFRYIPFLFYFFLIIFYTTLTHEFENRDNVIGEKSEDLVGWNLS